jgi:hypothetical protein
MERLSGEIYRCEEPSIVGLMEELERRYRSAEGWAEAKQVPWQSVDLLRERLLEG